MSELHWTGAAVLLALAVLGGEGARPRRTKIVSYAMSSREQAPPAASRPEAESPRRITAVPARGARPCGARGQWAS